MEEFSPTPRYVISELDKLPAELFQGDMTVYYPGAQRDTSIIKLVKATVRPEQFGRIKFVYQDPFYDREEIDRCIRTLGYSPDWSHERLDAFLEETRDENIELIPTLVQGYDLDEKADFIHLNYLPLYGDDFPFKIMANAKAGTYLTGCNVTLDQFCFLFSEIEYINENLRRVVTPGRLSKYGLVYEKSPELCELIFEYKYNHLDFMDEKMRLEAEEFYMENFNDGLRNMDPDTAKYILGLLDRKEMPPKAYDALSSLATLNND